MHHPDKHDDSKNQFSKKKDANATVAAPAAAAAAAGTSSVREAVLGLHSKLKDVLCTHLSISGEDADRVLDIAKASN